MVRSLLEHLFLSQLSPDPSFLGPLGLKIWFPAMPLVNLLPPKEVEKLEELKTSLSLISFFGEELASEGCLQSIISDTDTDKHAHLRPPP